MNNTVVNSRINYLDALRGFTIILVVFGHILLFSFNIPLGDSIIGDIFRTFRMPLFFFISGFVSYKSVEYWDNKYYIAKIKTKFRVQIISTLFFLTIFIFCIKTNPNANYLGFYDGYWFTIVLFEYLFIYFTMSKICNVTSDKYLTPILIFISALCVVFLGFARSDNFIWNLFCATDFFKYFQFFTFGIIAKKHSKQFLLYISKDSIKSLLILSYIFLLIIINISEFKTTNMLIYKAVQNVLVCYIGLLVVFMIFYSYRKIFDKNIYLIKFLCFIGRRTLDIYLLHYFFIPDLNFITKFLNEPNTSLIQLIIGLLLSILIVILTLLVSYCIRTSNILSYYILGAKQKKINNNV